MKKLPLIKLQKIYKLSQKFCISEGRGAVKCKRFLVIG